MKKNHSLALLCIGVLAITAILFSIKSGKFNKVRSSENVLDTKSVIDAFIEHIQINSGREKISKKRFATENLDSIDLQEIFHKGEEKLAVRIKDNQCMDCVDSLLAKLAHVMKGVGEDNIILVTSYHDIGEIQRLKKVRRFPYKIYNTNENILEHSLEISNSPTLFLLDSSLYPRSLFHFQTSFPHAAEMYMQILRKYFLDSYKSAYPITIPKTASIHLSKTSYDMGSLKYSDQAVVLVTYRNSSKHPLVITSIETECGCTEVSFTPAPVMAGDSGILSISYDTRRLGSFDKSIFVYSNAIESPTVIHVKGVVKKA